MVIKAIIFDCFGVLTEDGWLAFFDMYRTPENEEELRYINHQADKGLVSYEEFLRVVCQLTGAPAEEAHRIITTIHHPNKRLFDYISKLKKAGYHLSIISNVGNSLARFLPKHYLDLFEECTLSYDIHVIKPDPEIYRRHLSSIGFGAAECVFIDDRESNIIGAQAAGIRGVHYQNVEQVIAGLSNYGVGV